MPYQMDIKCVCRQIERCLKFKPEFFYAQHPDDWAPVRILLNGYTCRERGILRQELVARGFVVNYWQAR